MLQQQVVELSGYVIILVKNVEGKIKLYGSPPDRDNLEVGDEILEVNGLTLENISYAEIIRHIYEVGKLENRNVFFFQQIVLLISSHLLSPFSASNPVQFVCVCVRRMNLD